MPPRKTSNAKSKKGKNTNQRSKGRLDDLKLIWELVRGNEGCRWDRTPETYDPRYSVVVAPSSDDRAFCSTEHDTASLRVWDREGHGFISITVPAPYVIHIWWMQLQAKFWLDVNTGEVGMKSGRHLRWLLDTFVEE